jgi:prophage antirepressor-like protein
MTTTAATEPTKPTITANPPDFSINEWFNNLPIRIIGTHETPYFYASDIATVLGIKNIRPITINFDDIELVTPETRKQCGLITYRKYGESDRIDNTVVLLTELGVYRLIFVSRSKLAEPFKRYIYSIITRLRQEDTIRLRTQCTLQDAELLAKAAELAEYQQHNPPIFVFRKDLRKTSPTGQLVPDNGYSHIHPYERDDNDDKLRELCKKLYKFTTKPSHDDHASFSLYAKLYGNSEEILDISNDSLIINYKAFQYCRYYADFDAYDLSNKCKIIYQQN